MLATVGGSAVNIMWGFLWLLFPKSRVLTDVPANTLLVSEVDNVYTCMAAKLCHFTSADGISP